MDNLPHSHMQHVRLLEDALDWMSLEMVAAQHIAPGGGLWKGADVWAVMLTRRWSLAETLERLFESFVGDVHVINVSTQGGMFRAELLIWPSFYSGEGLLS